jgi:hypothetical protein
MNAAFFRCLARVLRMAAGSLRLMLPADSWASYVTYSEADSTYLPTIDGVTLGLAFMPCTNTLGPIRAAPVRPP